MKMCQKDNKPTNEQKTTQASNGLQLLLFRKKVGKIVYMRQK